MKGMVGVGRIFVQHQLSLNSCSQARHFGIHDIDVYQVQDLDKWLHERELMSTLIKQHLMCTQVRMKQQADKKHSEVSFDVGDQEFVKLKLYVQSSLAQRSH
jgi:hypothetical protein